MRSLAALLLTLFAGSLAASAQGATNLSLSIKVSGTTVLAGHDVTLSGRLSSGAAGRAIAIYSRRYGAGPRRIATVTTGAHGAWSARVMPTIQTSYQARMGSVVTPSVGLAVEPAISTRVLANGSIRAHVVGGRSLAGRALELQRAASGRWTTIERAVMNHRADATFPAPFASGYASLRVALSVNEAGPGLLGGRTDAFPYRAGRAFVALAARSATVAFGHATVLEGRVSAGAAGQRVSLTMQGYRGSQVTVRHLTTVAGGRFSFRAAPRIETIYRATWNGIASARLAVDVRPVLSVGLRSNDRLAVVVAPSKTFLGRNVELERAVGTNWRTVAELPLAGPSGAAVFSLPAVGPGARYRVAMSVNQAGAGYLGAISRPLAVSLQSVSLSPSTFKVLYGHTVTLTGTVSGGRSGEHVSILARPYGTGAAIEGATVLTGAGGRWSFRTEPAIETIFQARLGTSESRPVVVGVAPRVSVELLSSGKIAAHVLSKRSLSGRLVELQELNANHRWTTIGRARLDRRASAIFGRPDAGGSLTLRVAMSVNQAGAGLLGAASHAFVDRTA